MKYLTSFLLVLLSAAVCLAEPAVKDWRQTEGRVLIVRHGQRAPIVGREDGDPPLTELGRQQAELAGQYLRKLNFRGRIFASPYRRTLETASLIAQHTGGRIMVSPEIQELIRKGKPRIKQRTLAELRQEFPLIAEDATLEYPWAVSGPETLFTLPKRLEKALNGAAFPDPASDVLLVSHGGLLKGLDILMKNIPGPEIPKWEKVNWNCSISEYRLKKGAAPVCIRLFDVSFLPDEMVTSNARKMTADRRKGPDPASARSKEKK